MNTWLDELGQTYVNSAPAILYGVGQGVAASDPRTPFRGAGVGMAAGASIALKNKDSKNQQMMQQENMRLGQKIGQEDAAQRQAMQMEMSGINQGVAREQALFGQKLNQENQDYAQKIRSTERQQSKQQAIEDYGIQTNMAIERNAAMREAQRAEQRKQSQYDNLNFKSGVGKLKPKHKIVLNSIAAEIASRNKDKYKVKGYKNAGR